MAMPIRQFTTAALCALLMLALATPALADSLDQAKTAGHVGEQADGYLGVPPGAPASGSALASQINAQRRKHYQSIAAKNGTSVSVVEKLAGKKLISRAPAGQYIRNSTGRWEKRP